MENISRPLHWVPGSREELLELPKEVIAEVGYALSQVQFGEFPANAKALTGKNFQGVYEIRVRNQDGTYRAVYVVNLTDAIYVLHCFQKKSVKGIATPQRHLDLIVFRLKTAKEGIHDRP